MFVQMVYNMQRHVKWTIREGTQGWIQDFWKGGGGVLVTVNC